MKASVCQLQKWHWSIRTDSIENFVKKKLIGKYYCPFDATAIDGVTVPWWNSFQYVSNLKTQLYFLLQPNEIMHINNAVAWVWRNDHFVIQLTVAQYIADFWGGYK
jgi:hypothetical protein